MKNHEKQPENRTARVPLDTIVSRCDHDWIFILECNVSAGIHTTRYRRCHWCCKCGSVQISVEGVGWAKKELKLGMTKKEVERIME